MNIFHRDIKSANILLTKHAQETRLADMNVSKISKSGLAVTQTGTPYYASPEVWSDLPYNGKCDIWSLGCVLYEMAAQRPPFTAHDIHTLKKRISAGVFDRIPSFYSEEL
jgi:NIMA (never in mitosis gene a)-related kinase